MNTVSLFTFREPLPNKTQQNQRKAKQAIHVEKYIESNFPPGKIACIKPSAVKSLACVARCMITISRARTIGSRYDFDTWSLVPCAMSKCALTSVCVSSSISSVLVLCLMSTRISSSISSVPVLYAHTYMHVYI